MATKERHGHLKVLDGWRGISILAVLACHFLPLGPKSWGLNDAAGYFGMAIFFCLSGFLITNFLLKDPGVWNFLIRRFCRILPLAWLAMPIGLAMAHAPVPYYLHNLLFIANYPPFYLTPVTGHLWSLCVEMQFYVTIALVYGFLGRRSLYWTLPLGCLAVTVMRAYAGVYGSIVTHHRVDEILAGGILALVYASDSKRWFSKVHPIAILVLFMLSTHVAFGFANYFRPYFAAVLVGSTLVRRSPLAPLLAAPWLAYIAEVSYALYVWHPIVADTWLSSGSTFVKYLKRPLLFAAVFATAHASTFWYEKRWIEAGRRWSSLSPSKGGQAQRSGDRVPSTSENR
jgi:peptidoglycan/LPS O-acetylase OafA/YrhL